MLQQRYTHNYFCCEIVYHLRSKFKLTQHGVNDLVRALLLLLKWVGTNTTNLYKCGSTPSLSYPSLVMKINE